MEFPKLVSIVSRDGEMETTSRQTADTNPTNDFSHHLLHRTSFSTKCIVGPVGEVIPSFIIIVSFVSVPYRPEASL